MDELRALRPGLGQQAGADDSLELDLIPDPAVHGTARSQLLRAVHEHEASGFRITVRQKYLVHGTIAGDDKESATLLVLQFELRKTGPGSNQHRRFRRLNVTLRFERDPRKLPVDDPYVLSYAPAQDGVIYLLPTLVHRSEETTTGATAEVQQDPVPVKLGLNREKKAGKEWEQLRKATISAQAWKTEKEGGGRQGENVICWSFDENEKQESLPDTFGVAVVIRRPKSCKFRIFFDLDAKIDLWYKASVAWQEAKDKVTFKGVSRDKSKDFDPRVQGVLPKGANANNLKAFVESKALNDLAFLHLPEEVEPVSFYQDGQKRASNTVRPDAVYQAVAATD